MMSEGIKVVEIAEPKFCDCSAIKERHYHITDYDVITEDVYREAFKRFHLGEVVQMDRPHDSIGPYSIGLTVKGK